AVLPASEVVAHARRIAERFNTLPPGAVRETKRLLKRGNAELIASTITDEAKVFAGRLTSPEAKEAVSAFFQKRRPDFSQFS
ncbi:MAG: enoyl-CoA hydratase, partial [Rhizobacter sp.]|nr:enoyl-CoA hydratase [Rhizobacter sp.]